MTLRTVLTRVHRGGVVGLVVVVTAAVVALCLVLLPAGSVYPSVTSIAPAVFAVCAGLAIAGTVFASPRMEAAEVTASRSLRTVRLIAAALLGAAVVPLAALVCLLAGSGWFFLPVLRSGAVVGAATLALAVLVPRRYVGVLALLYVTACYYLARGTQWWDLVLSHPARGNLAAALLIVLASGATYAYFGARTVPPDDDE